MSGNRPWFGDSTLATRPFSTLATAFAAIFFPQDWIQPVRDHE